MNPGQRITTRPNPSQHVLTSHRQPEVPEPAEQTIRQTVPDGGYGWVVFLSTLFFQALIPSMIVNFGLFLAFTKLRNLTKDDINPFLWDDRLIYAPLLFLASWTFFDPSARALISSSTWPRLVATSGTCLTCAGLLFLWMGMAGYGELAFYPLAGIISGVGASIQISQCEILLAQYFRVKHTILAYVSQTVAALGFVISPVVIGHHILSSNIWNVVLWYQAVIIQGLICGLTFKKPLYLKSVLSTRYNHVSTNPDEEEDIFSKNSRELQIRRQDSTGTNITIVKHEIPQDKMPQQGPSSSSNPESEAGKNWEVFEDDEEEESTKYEVLKKDWEVFDDDDDDDDPLEAKAKEKDWVVFKENDISGDQAEPNVTNLQTELSSAEKTNGAIPRTSLTETPRQLFLDTPVNNNTTYSYDSVDPEFGAIPQPAVFMPSNGEQRSRYASLDILRQPTFYKSLLTVMTTKFSVFIYYTLFPTYLYQELAGLKMRGVAVMVGWLSVTNVVSSVMSYWVNIDKKRRPICMWFMCWVGSFGYFMVSDSNTRYVLILGAIQVSLSIATLQYVGMPLLGLTIRGETNKEFNLISTLTGFTFLFFFVINSSFKNCFRLMALLHFFTGAVWSSNYIYKKIMK